MTITNLSPRPRGVRLSVEELRSAWAEAVAHASAYVAYHQMQDTVPDADVLAHLTETADQARDAYFAAVQR